MQAFLFPKPVWKCTQDFRLLRWFWDTAAVSCLQGISRVRPASRQVPELEASSKSRSRAEAPRGRSLPTESRAVFS